MSNVLAQPVAVVPNLATFQSSPVSGYAPGQSQLAYLQGQTTELDGGQGFYQLRDNDYSTAVSFPTIIADSTGARWSLTSVVTAAQIAAALAGTPLPIASGGTGAATAVAALGALSTQGANIAAAATVDLGAATGQFVVVTGNTGPITSLGTATAGVTRVVRFTGTPTLTYNASSLILPGAADITAAAGDIAGFISLGAGNWQCTFYTELAGGTPGTLPIAQGGTGSTTAIAAAIALSPKGADIASAATINLATATGPVVDITGNTGPVTSLGTVAAGARFTLRFASTPTLTHNATSLILPTGANITAAAGDVATFISLGSGNWYCASYQRATGLPLATIPVANGGTGAVTAQAAQANLAGWYVLAKSAVAQTAPADTNENILATVTIPAGAMGANGCLRIQSVWSMTASANAKTLRNRLGGIGGTEFLSRASGATNTSYYDIRYISNRNAQNSQVGQVPTASVGFGTTTTATTSSVDTSAETTLVFTGQKASAGESLVLESYLVELSYGA